MTFRTSVFIAASLDGYIARPDGAIDWLEQANACVPAGEDCGYAAFMSTVDLLVMGRATFEKVLAFPAWPFAERPVWVASRSGPALPAHLPHTVRVTDETPARIVHSAQVLGFRHLYVDGGQLIQAFLRENLIDELTITTIPVLLGSGRTLFGALSSDVPLQLVATRAYPFGFVQSTYRVLPA
ncbi:MAG: dihydrofolate reductase family protein [Pseudomonadota bacterium]